MTDEDDQQPPADGAGGQPANGSDRGSGGASAGKSASLPPLKKRLAQRIRRALGKLNER